MFLKRPQQKDDSATVHEGVQCDECRQFPLNGIRYKCGNCTDYDLCEACESKTTHDPSHVFIQIRTPLPDVYADLHTPLLSSPVYQDSVPSIRSIPIRKACMPRRPPLSCDMPPPQIPQIPTRPPSPPRLGCAPPPQILIPTRPPSPPQLGCAPPPQIVRITVTHNCNTYPDIVLSRHESPSKVLERVQALSPQLKNVTLSTLSRSVTQGKFNANQSNMYDWSEFSMDIKLDIEPSIERTKE